MDSHVKVKKLNRIVETIDELKKNIKKELEDVKKVHEEAQKVKLKGYCKKGLACGRTN